MGFAAREFGVFFSCMVGQIHHTSSSVSSFFLAYFRATCIVNRTWGYEDRGVMCLAEEIRA